MFWSLPKGSTHRQEREKNKCVLVSTADLRTSADADESGNSEQNGCKELEENRLEEEQLPSKHSVCFHVSSWQLIHSADTSLDYSTIFVCMQLGHRALFRLARHQLRLLVMQ